MRVVFRGSPPFATPILKRLLEGPHEVLGLVTPPDRPRGRGRKVVRSPLVEVALANGVEVVQPTTTKDDAFVERLGAFGADALAVASYGEILRTNVLELCPHGALNVHASLLPRWRGASPIQRAIAAGDAETGVTIQRMVLALDAGPVAVTRRTPIGERETAADLFERLSILGADALVEALDRIEAGDASFEPQDEGAVTLAPKLRKADGVVDFSRSSADVDRHVRAMTTWPGARTTLPDGRDLVVLEARPAEGSLGAEDSGALPGTVLDEASFAVRSGDGAVQLRRVKPAGKGAMDGDAFLRGARIARGERLGG
ncbi:MAG: methionyl-tRNA formyltransferase [Planctomycetota bacterium]